MRALPKHNETAFSLTEMLVVVAIIGILAALLLPALSSAKARAQRIQCVNNLHQLGVGLQVFVEDTHSYPVLVIGTNGGPAVARSPWFTWADILERDGLGIANPGSNCFQKGIWLCPSAQKSLNFYGYNSSGIIYPATRTNDLGLGGHFIPHVDIYKPITDSEVAAPSDMMAIGDSFYGGAEFLRGKMGEGTPADDLLTHGNTPTRHQGRANVVFCDSHVESPTLKFLFQDTSDAALVRWNRNHLPHRDRLSP